MFAKITSLNLYLIYNFPSEVDLGFLKVKHFHFDFLLNKEIIIIIFSFKPDFVPFSF